MYVNAVTIEILETVDKIETVLQLASETLLMHTFQVLFLIYMLILRPKTWTHTYCFLKCLFTKKDKVNIFLHQIYKPTSSLLLLFVILGIEPRASSKLGKYSLAFA